MGQSSIPILNRNGYTMFWLSVWDNKDSFNKNFKEDIYIRKYIELIFSDKISSRPILLTNKYFDLVKKNNFDKYNLKLTTELNTYSFSKYLLKLNKLPNYRFKTYIVRFQSWVVIYFNIYTPNPLKKVIFLKKHRNMSNLFKKYYLTQFSSRFLKNKFEF
jgi:hypothetical protein